MRQTLLILSLVFVGVGLAQAQTPCVSGSAGIYDCNGIDLQANMTLSQLGASGIGNDIWGWTDPMTGKEYALMGLNNGVAFVDISNPTSPVRIGNLATHTSSSSWRDIKVYRDHAFIVSEAGGHGMQVFDLTKLRTITSTPATLTATAHYSQMSNSHNIAINEETGFAYAVGTNTCSGGLHMINIQNPTSPSFAGCYSGDGYTHDVQCVVYHGPDAAHQGKEICFAYNTDTLTIIDVTNKSAPVQLSRTTYTQEGYTHQGWLSEDHRYALANDEFDESQNGFNTRTLIWDLADLDNPTVTFYFGPVRSIDHNLYTRNGIAFEANYKSGLRLVDLSNLGSGNLSEVAFFDTYPSSNSTGYDGAWSNYPYFCSGNVVVSDINRGLFILKPNALPSEICTSSKIHLQGGYQEAANLQSTKLNTDGLIPTTHPFGGAPWNYSGTESVPDYDVITANGNADFFELNPEIADWVLLELRTAPEAASAIARRAVFLTESGLLVDTDGRSQVRFPGVPAGDYHLVIMHRNHQALMSKVKVTLNGATGAYNFTDLALRAYGANPMILLETGVYGMRGGDADANGSTTAFDLLTGWLPVNGTTGYLQGDFNLDGQATASDMLGVWLNANGTQTQVPN